MRQVMILYKLLKSHKAKFPDISVKEEKTSNSLFLVNRILEGTGTLAEGRKTSHRENLPLFVIPSVITFPALTFSDLLVTFSH